eukprot:Colp12_sorted_trinity150504_noHs@1904
MKQLENAVPDDFGAMCPPVSSSILAAPAADAGLGGPSQDYEQNSTTSNQHSAPPAPVSTPTPTEPPVHGSPVAEIQEQVSPLTTPMAASTDVKVEPVHQEEQQQEQPTAMEGVTQVSQQQPTSQMVLQPMASITPVMPVVNLPPMMVLPSMVPPPMSQTFELASGPMAQSNSPPLQSTEFPDVHDVSTDPSFARRIKVSCN